MNRLRLAFIFPLVLCGCSTPPASTPPVDYGRLEKINLDVKDLNFVDRGLDRAPPSPTITDQFTPTIAEAIHAWASQRLQAVGVTGSAAFVVKNVYVTEQGIANEGSWFERGQTHKYTGHAEIEFDARGAEGHALATANATRAVSLPDNADEDEKRDAYRTLLNGLMQDLNTYLDEAIHNHMKDFIVTAPVIGSKLPGLAAPESPGQSP